jgi:hypothetical protein
MDPAIAAVSNKAVFDAWGQLQQQYKRFRKSSSVV